MQENNITSFILNRLNEPFNIDNVTMFEKVDGVIIPVTPIFFQKYKTTILANSVEITMDEKTFRPYYQSPKKMSYHLYETTSLWYILLWINNMTCVQQFTRGRLKVFNPENLYILTEILNTERDTIESNRNLLGI